MCLSLSLSASRRALPCGHPVQSQLVHTHTHIYIYVCVCARLKLHCHYIIHMFVLSIMHCTCVCVRVRIGSCMQSYTPRDMRSCLCAPFVSGIWPPLRHHLGRRPFASRHSLWHPHMHLRPTYVIRILGLTWAQKKMTKMSEILLEQGCMSSISISERTWAMTWHQNLIKHLRAPMSYTYSRYVVYPLVNIDPENNPSFVETSLPTPICQGLYEFTRGYQWHFNDTLKFSSAPRLSQVPHLDASGGLLLRIHASSL